MRTIAITYPHYYEGEVEAIVKALASGKYWRLHIRKPGATVDALRALIESIPANYRKQITLHDHFCLAVEYGLGGLHLNSRNPDPIEGWEGLVSRSIHSPGEIAGVSDGYAYAFISPVYPSISKPGYKADFTLAELRPLLNDRIFALGGVTPDRLEELAGYGFGGAAMLGSVWRKQLDSSAFKLQFITHPSPRMSLAEEAARVIAGGGRWIQLRHKEATPGQLLAEGEEIAALCRERGATFIIDDHVELVGPLGADGVHLGKNDMPVAEARKILGPEKIIGATANEFADIERAWLAGADYIGLGPFRFTTTKQKLSPTLGLGGYQQIAAQCREAGIALPIVAIGGITQADIPEIMATGVGGVAISSAILTAPDPAAKTAEILKVKI